MLRVGAAPLPGCDAQTRHTLKPASSPALLLYRGVPYSNLTSVANALRSALGPDVTLYTNECMEMEKWSVVPSALDYISLDLYDYHNGTNEPVIVRQAYE